MKIMIQFILFGRCVAFLKLKSKPIWILTLSLSAQAQICGSNFPTVPITNRREWVRFHINLGSIYTDDWWKRPSGQIYDLMALFIGLSQVMLASRSKPMQRVFTLLCTKNVKLVIWLLLLRGLLCLVKGGNLWMRLRSLVACVGMIFSVQYI